jgi:hypothetical protein
VHIFHALGEENLTKGNNAKQYAFDREVEQGLNAAQIAASPIVMKTLERFIWSTLADATKLSGGKITTVYHYDSKAEVTRQIHERFPHLASRLSLVQLGHYIQNWKAFPLMAPQKQADGTYLTVRPFKPSTEIEFVDPSRDTGRVVKSLVELPPGKHILAVSEQMTWPEWMELWGKIYGVKAGYKQVSSEEFWKGVPPVLAEELKDAWDFAEEFGHTGGDPDVLRPNQVEPNILMSSMEDCIKGQDWSSVLQG